MSWFSKIFREVGRVAKQAAPVAIGYATGGPAGALLAATSQLSGGEPSPLVGAAMQAFVDSSPAPIKDYAAQTLVAQYSQAAAELYTPPFFADQGDYYDDGGSYDESGDTYD